MKCRMQTPKPLGEFFNLSQAGISATKVSCSENAQ